MIVKTHRRLDGMCVERVGAGGVDFLYHRYAVERKRNGRITEYGDEFKNNGAFRFTHRTKSICSRPRHGSLGALHRVTPLRVTGLTG